MQLSSSSLHDDVDIHFHLGSVVRSSIIEEAVAVPGTKSEKVYKALVDGANEGLVGEGLRAVIALRCPNTTDGTLRDVSRLALGDYDVTDPDVLCAIYSLAVR